MAGRKRRELSDADRVIWEKVTLTTRPLHPDEKHPSRKQSERTFEPGSNPPAKPAGPSARKVNSEDSPAARYPGAEPATASSGTALDRRRYDRLRRGKIAPEARIDLHGMTAARAQPELAEFIVHAYARGLRLVLVITGKGSMKREEDSIMPQRRGVLRHSVPQWLARPPLGPMILEVTSAHARHGGGGAFYVYLRRSRG